MHTQVIQQTIITEMFQSGLEFAKEINPQFGRHKICQMIAFVVKILK